MIIAERKKSQTPHVILKMKKKRINVHEWTNKKHKNEAKSRAAAAACWTLLKQKNIEYGAES